MADAAYTDCLNLKRRLKGWYATAQRSDSCILIRYMRNSIGFLKIKETDFVGSRPLARVFDPYLCPASTGKGHLRICSQMITEHRQYEWLQHLRAP